MFFFSSRRRHTRFKCDWSSDVCSSDLFENGTGNRFETAGCCNVQSPQDRYRFARGPGSHPEPAYSAASGSLQVAWQGPSFPQGIVVDGRAPPPLVEIPEEP